METAESIVELGEKLPPRILMRKDIFLADSEENWDKYEDDDDVEILWLSIGSISEKGERSGWSCSYGTDGVSYLQFDGKTMAGCMAKMLEHLIEENIIDVK